MKPKIMRAQAWRPRRETARRLALAYWFVAIPGALAAGYPDHPVRVIVPYPPGGGNDVIARAVTGEMTKRMGQQVIVDNRAGGSTVIGAEMTAKAPPDGYTLMATSHTTLAIVPNLRPRLPYDPQRDFEPISLLATQPFLLVVHPSLPVTTVKQLVALAKAKPGTLTFSSPAVGSGGHLSAELLKSMAGINMLHVPYKGGAPALTDLIGGHISIMFATMGAVHSFIDSGRLRPIAITGRTRSPAVPGVPTVAESGITGYEMVGWNAMYAPRATPRNVIDRLNAEIVEALKTRELRDRLASQGYEPESSTPQQLADRIKSELARYGKLIKTIGLKDE